MKKTQEEDTGTATAHTSLFYRLCPARTAPLSAEQAQELKDVLEFERIVQGEGADDIDPQTINDALRSDSVSLALSKLTEEEKFAIAEQKALAAKATQSVSSARQLNSQAIEEPRHPLRKRLFG